MPGESTHRSIPSEKEPELEAEETGLPGPGRTSGVGDGEGRMKYSCKIDVEAQDKIEEQGRG